MDSLLARFRRGSAPQPVRRALRHPPSTRRTAEAARALRLCALVGLACFGAIGCTATNWVKLREAPRNPLAQQLNLFARGGPKPTERTMQYLRRYDLAGAVDDDPKELLAKVQETLSREPSPEGCQAFAELAYIGGIKSQNGPRPQRALDLFGASVAHAYLYLFDDKFGQYRNPYDPQFRHACDLYNGALESSLRIVKKHGSLRPGSTQSVELAGQTWDITVAVRSGSWKEEEFDRCEFVSDYEINGLQNRYHTYGLGVPLIVVRKAGPAPAPADRYLPPSTSFPMTAFLRLLPDAPAAGGSPNRHRAVLELYDPLTSSDIQVAGRRIPLETDLSTALAFALNDPALAKLDQSTSGLLRPETAKELTGLYMLEPYQPQKIPVLFVHGLWSSPITWMEMFNDLQGSPELRAHYQFWFYLYPTGQPFWTSATRMREDLAEMRNVVDPHRLHPAQDQMVLVGHSMGGLVSRLQTLDSGEDFWKVVSERPFGDLKAEPDVRAKVERLFFFQPNPSVRRVVTIGTPHRGSSFANDTTRYFGNKLISLPAMLVMQKQQIRQDNPGLFRDEAKVFEVSTSIDSLSPKSPFLPAMLSARRPPWTRYHNIVGRVPAQGVFGRVAGDGDGIVEFTSAHLDDVESEIVVPADHVNVHRHPLAVLEVRRILLEHLNQLRANPNPDPSVPRTAAR